MSSNDDDALAQAIATEDAQREVAQALAQLYDVTDDRLDSFRVTWLTDYGLSREDAARFRDLLRCMVESIRVQDKSGLARMRRAHEAAFGVRGVEDSPAKAAPAIPHSAPGASPWAEGKAQPSQRTPSQRTPSQRTPSQRTPPLSPPAQSQPQPPPPPPPPPPSAGAPRMTLEPVAGFGATAATNPQAVKRPATPFRGSRKPEGPIASKLEPSAALGGTVAMNAEVKPSPATPFSPPTLERADGLDKYAALCAALEVEGADRARVLAEHNIADEAALEAVHQTFLRAFDKQPSLPARYAQLLLTHRSKLKTGQ